MRSLLPLCLTVLAVGLLPAGRAAAFCGFYVAGADDPLVNKATMVVMMRDGTRTVLSMQNNYEGPPENFAMVIPVPEILQEENVKVLPEAVFERVDHLAAPRLVEYWERDPCQPERPTRRRRSGRRGAVLETESAAAPGGLGVTVEAQFAVGEYDIVILSAREANGLDTWLRGHGYSIPAGAAEVLRPYVASGMKFFVAKVDVTKVRFANGRAELSPLRFHYDAPTFSLPVRLGLLNSAGAQDLLVHILAPNQRYEMANYGNVTIPTNIDVGDDTRNNFPAFYAALFDETMDRNPRSVVTEYAWQATNCDPCPGPVLTQSDLMTLGADVLPSINQNQAAAPSLGRRRRPRPPSGLMNFVLTRLHTRYDRSTLDEDLVFRAAPPIVGGREHLAAGGGGELEHGSSPSGANNFQGRYAIRHEWEGPIECANPIRGRWGGPPQNQARPPVSPATDLAYAPRGTVSLQQMVRQSVPEIGLSYTPPSATPTPVTTAGVNPAPTPAAPATGSAQAPLVGADEGSCAASPGQAPAGVMPLLLLGWLFVRRLNPLRGFKEAR